MSGTIPYMAEYPGAAWAGVSPNRSARTGEVKLFIVHHYAGTQRPDAARARFMAANDRSVSPNYQVNADGSTFEIVPPDRYRAWTTGAIDHQAVTCETQNTSGAPSWGVSRASHEAIAALIAWASKRYGFPIQRGRVADGNVVTVPGVVGHRETPAGRQTSTACPGPSMDLDWLVNRAREIASGQPAGGGETPAPKPPEHWETPYGRNTKEKDMLAVRINDGAGKFGEKGKTRTYTVGAGFFIETTDQPSANEASVIINGYDAKGNPAPSPNLTYAELYAYAKASGALSGADLAPFKAAAGVV